MSELDLRTRLAWPTVAILCLTAALPAHAMRAGRPAPGVSAAATGASVGTGVSSSSTTRASAAGAGAARTGATASPNTRVTSMTPGHAGSIHQPSTPIRAMMRAQPGASSFAATTRPASTPPATAAPAPAPALAAPAQASGGGGSKGDGADSTSVQVSRVDGISTPGASRMNAGQTNGRGSPGASQPAPGRMQSLASPGKDGHDEHRQNGHAPPGDGAPVTTTTAAPNTPTAVTAPSAAPTDRTASPGSTPDATSTRFAQSAGTGTGTRSATAPVSSPPSGSSSSSSTPARAVASVAPVPNDTRSSARVAAAEARPAPLAEIVPTAAEWADARRLASSSRVAPLSQTQTVAGTKVARTADCVPTVLAPDARQPGQLTIGRSSRDLARTVGSAQDVARVLARTRFDGIDLGVAQSMCLPPDLAGRLAQLPPPAANVATKPAASALRAGRSRVEPATGATG